jgi:hypothetical protein
MHHDIIYKFNEKSYLYSAYKIEHLDLEHHFTMNTEMPMTLYWYFT